MPRNLQLTKKMMRDGSLLFASLPATASPDTLVHHLRRMPGVEILEPAATTSDTWIVYSLEGRTFDVNEQFGEYWFVAHDPETPEETLRAIASYACDLLWEDPEVAMARSRREAWGGALLGLAAFALAALFRDVRDSPLVLILVFAAGTTVGCIAVGMWRGSDRAHALQGR